MYVYDAREKRSSLASFSPAVQCAASCNLDHHGEGASVVTPTFAYTSHVRYVWLLWVERNARRLEIQAWAFVTCVQEAMLISRLCRVGVIGEGSWWTDDARFAWPLHVSLP